jgi:hypothetical protein
MEEDRLATNLGPTADFDIIPEPQVVTKQPKRRFVGRKAAEELAQKASGESKTDAEASTSIEGIQTLHLRQHSDSDSCSTKAADTCLEQYTPRDIKRQRH